MRWLFLVLALPLAASEESLIQDWITLKDYTQARDRAFAALKENPESITLRQLRIKTLAKTAQINEMLEEWQKLKEMNAESALDRDLVEDMAWGVIQHGHRSSSPLTRVFALLAAAFAQDILGVELVKEELLSPNSLIRQVACQLTAKLGDDILKEPISHLCLHERVLQVKLMAIVAAGALRITSLKDHFAASIDKSSTSEEEKEACLQALVSMQGDISLFELESLLKGQKEHQKCLGCKLALLAGFPLDPSLFTNLLNDHSSLVRISSLRALGLLFYSDKDHREALLKAAQKGLEDVNAQVVVTALWLKTLLDPATALPLWNDFLTHKDGETRLFASSLLGTLGTKTAPLMIRAIKSNNDPFVRWNLALGLIKQRHGVELALDTLVSSLSTSHPRWMWKEKMGVRTLAPTELSFASNGGSPIDTHNLCQLEVLSVISLIDQKRAESGLKEFLKQPQWSLSGPAASLLLTEGPQEGIEVVEKLLQSKDFPFRVEASILLALWGGDPKSARELENFYESSPRKSKEAILEALGRVGDDESIPFLVMRLKEPYPMLRTIAASSILQVLNH